MVRFKKIFVGNADGSYDSEDMGISEGEIVGDALSIKIACSDQFMFCL